MEGIDELAGSVKKHEEVAGPSRTCNESKEEEEEEVSVLQP